MAIRRVPQEEKGSGYKYFIYRIDSLPDAEGEYIGPFDTEAERDEQARRMRTEGTPRRGLRCAYRANIAAGLVDTLVAQKKNAA